MTESGYSNVDQTSDPTEYVRRLDDVGAHEFWQAIKRRTFALLDPHEGDHILDVGCGTGDDVRALAQLVGPTGRVVGVDSSATMIAEAERRTKGSGLAVDFYLGDAHHLDFPDESFDGCRAERVFQHLDDPGQAFAELVRVARSGAWIVVVEPDYGAVVITGADPAVTRKILQCRCDHFRSGTIGRRLPGLFKESKLTDISITLLHTTAIGIIEEGERSFLRKLVTGALSAGALSAREGRTWLTDLEKAAQVGQYRRATPIFLMRGRKPSIDERSRRSQLN